MDDLKDDIEKYLRGELPEARMHALEKQALTDPFLTDALEGASGIDVRQFAEDTAQLRKNLRARLGEKKIIPLWVWTARIAAGLLVIAVSAYIIRQLQAPRQPESTAYNEAKLPAPAGGGDTTKTTRDNGYLSMNDTEERPQTPSPPSLNTSPVPPPAQAPSVPQASQAGASQTAAHEETIQTTEPITQAEAVESETADVARKEAAAPAQPQADKAVTAGEEAPKEYVYAEPSGHAKAKRQSDLPPGFSMQADSAATDNRVVIRGRVTSTEDGGGLPGVNVVIKGTTTGTVTDINGNYEIRLEDPKATLVYSFIGLESKEMPVSNGPTMNIALNQDVAQLSEVVVVGYGEGKEEESRAFTTFDMAEPVGGKRAFKKYLEDKMVYPREALDNKIEGKVTIQFTVETTGQISNFNVVKGIGYGCDDEVIRLIKEGPRWAPMKRDDEPVKGRVHVRMRFSLPKKK